jgi:tetratricopeptide (TPR) repeat protein
MSAPGKKLVWAAAALTASLAAGAGAISAIAAPQAPGTSADVPTLIRELSDRDPAVRKRAADRLAGVGAPARAEVVKASRSQDPEQRAQAAQILLRLPWWNPDDPPRVRELLNAYGVNGVQKRAEIIWRLDNEQHATDVLIRLLQEEPSERVRWSIVSALADRESVEVQKKLRALDVSDDDPPTLTIAGKAWLTKDKSRGLELLRRAIDADARRTTPDAGGLSYAFAVLTEAALDAGDFDQAADLLRRQVPRNTASTIVRRRRRITEEGTMPAAARLLALHAYFGPLRGYAFDVAAWSPTGGGAAKVEILDNLIDLFDELGAAPPLPRPLTSGLGSGDRYDAAAFLLEHEWIDAADLELRSALQKDQETFAGANLTFLLSRVAVARNDDIAAADALERGMQIKAKLGLTLYERGDDDVWAEIHWRRARAATARGDAAAAAAAVKNLAQFAPTNSDVALSMIDWLRHNDHETEAKKMFDRVYAQARARVDSNATRPSPGPKNDLAWLCARAGERLNEALELATAAVAADADNPAFLDTLAECHFRAGHRDRAIQLEMQALAMRPDEKFMKEQLERFKTAAIP